MNEQFSAYAHGNVMTMKSQPKLGFITNFKSKMEKHH